MYGAFGRARGPLNGLKWWFLARMSVTMTAQAMGRLAHALGGLGGQWYDEGEHIQVVKYTSAQMYEAHYDYFNPRDYTGQVRCWPLLPPHSPHIFY
jgi:hypothetical protein